MLNKKAVTLAILVALLLPIKPTPDLCWWNILYPQLSTSATNDDTKKPVIKFKLLELFDNS